MSVKNTENRFVLEAEKKQTSCQKREFFMVSGLKAEIDWYVETFEATVSSKLFPPAVWNWLCIHDAKCKWDLLSMRENNLQA